MHCRGWIVLIAAMMLAACSSGKSPPPDRVGAAQGIGTVVEIDPQQYTATVETADRRILCYWTQDTIFIYKNQAMKNYVPAVERRSRSRVLKAAEKCSSCRLWS